MSGLGLISCLVAFEALVGEGEGLIAADVFALESQLLWGFAVSRVLVIYYSRTGNTEKMVDAVAEGAGSVGGVDVEVQVDSDVSPEALPGFGVIVVGVPTYHHDMTVGIKALFEESAVKSINLKDRVGATFGSFGWSGEAPRLVLEIMKNKFGMNTVEPPLLVKYTPDNVALQKCREFGAAIAKKATF